VSSFIRNVRTNPKGCANEGIITIIVRDRVAVGARLYRIAPELYPRAMWRSTPQ